MSGGSLSFKLPAIITVLLMLASMSTMVAGSSSATPVSVSRKLQEDDESVQPFNEWNTTFRIGDRTYQSARYLKAAIGGAKQLSQLNGSFISLTPAEFPSKGGVSITAIVDIYNESNGEKVHIVDLEQPSYIAGQIGSLEIPRTHIRFSEREAFFNDPRNYIAIIELTPTQVQELGTGNHDLKLTVAWATGWTVALESTIRCYEPWTLVVDEIFGQQGEYRWEETLHIRYHIETSEAAQPLRGMGIFQVKVRMMNSQTGQETTLRPYSIRHLSANNFELILARHAGEPPLTTFDWVIFEVEDRLGHAEMVEQAFRFPTSELPVPEPVSRPIEISSPNSKRSSRQPAPLGGSGVAVPSTGDWVINIDTVRYNETIMLNGSIRVLSGANLTLQNVTLRMNSLFDGDCNITVNSGGILKIVENSTVTAVTLSNAWYLQANAGSTILLKNSTFSYAGYSNSYRGLEINTDWAQITNCTILDNYNGVYLTSSSSDNTVASNIIANSSGYGIFLSSSSNNAITRNTVINSSSFPDGGIRLDSSTNNTVARNTVTNSIYGIYLMSSSNNTFANNTVIDSLSSGIILWGSSNNTIANNTATNSSQRGISLLLSSNNTIANNTVTNSFWSGIYLEQPSNNNTIANNTVTNSSQHGISLSTASNNTIISNTVTNSSSYGIDLVSSAGFNLIYSNSILNNTGGQAQDDNGTNTFYHNGLGNYWGNAYTGTDANGDGIGDTPFNIAGTPGNQDPYPLMYPAFYQNWVYMDSDWIVTSTENRQNEVITLAGNLLIQSGGDLTLTNVTLRILCQVNGTYRVQVFSGGVLSVQGDSLITSGNVSARSYFIGNSSSTLQLQDSTFSYLGWEFGINGDHGGVWINTDGVQIVNSTFNMNYYGLTLYQAQNIQLVNNTFLNNSLYGIYLRSSSDNIMDNNTIMNTGGNGIYLFLCPPGNNTITNNFIKNSGSYGVYGQNSPNSTLVNNTIINSNSDGVRLLDFDDSIIKGNSVANSSAWTGLNLWTSVNLTVSSNTIMNSTYYGIQLLQTDLSTVYNNTITNSSDALNGIGILLDQTSSNNTVSNNTVTNSGAYGIYIYVDAGFNLIYTNNFFLNNPSQARDNNGTNLFYYNGLGNYWGSGYSGTDANGDGIGDTPYAFTGNSDPYPLMNSYTYYQSWTYLASDWVVTGTESRQNEVITLAGNLLIQFGGNLTLSNVTLRILCQANGTYRVEVYSGGELNVLDDSHLTSGNISARYYIRSDSGSSFSMENSTISYSGYNSGSSGTTGIWIASDYAQILNSTIQRNYYAMYLSSSDNHTIQGNTIIASEYEGIFVLTSKNSIISYNNISLSGNDGVFLSAITNSTVSFNTITNSSYGIYLSGSSNNTVSGNTVTNSSQNGIYLSGSSNNTVSYNTVTNSSSVGIFIQSSGNSTIAGNTVTDSSYQGIRLSSSENCSVTSNFVTRISQEGIYLSSSDNSTVSHNNITNSWYGIHLASNNGNCQILGNFLASNAWEGYDENGTNQWDNGAYGNWWDDYAGVDTNNDGIGDTVYAISGGASALDRYPLMSNPAFYQNWVYMDSDWIVTSTENRQNEVITLAGNLTIQSGGDLTLSNVTLRILCPANGTNRVQVYFGGVLSVLDNSVLTSGNVSARSYFIANDGSTLQLKNSTFNYLGWTTGPQGDYRGLKIRSDGAQIINCTIHDNYNGLYLYYSDGGIIANNTITNSISDGLYSFASNNNTVSGNFLTNNAGVGIYLYSSIGDSENNTILGNNVTNSGNFGIYFSSNHNSTIVGNIVTNSSYGIRLDSSDDCTVTGNIITNSDSDGIRLNSADNSTISGNSVTNSSSGAGIWLWNSGNSTVSNNTFVDSGNQGIRLENSGNSTLSNNTITNSGSYGLWVDTSNVSTIHNNTIINATFYGILLEYSSDCNITGNSVTNSSSIGIGLYSTSTNCTVSQNTVTNSGSLGISLSSWNSTITNNTITKSGSAGLQLNSIAGFTSIYGNNILNNTGVQAQDDNGTNWFYYNGLGNHWGNAYTGTDANGDGIGDTPYNIAGTPGNQDPYPLMYPTGSYSSIVGDWIVTSTESRKNEVITLTGNLLIQSGGILTLQNVLLRMNGSFDGQYNITIYNGGNLTIEANSMVTAFNSSYAWYLAAKAGSTILLNDSTFSYAGWQQGLNGDLSGLWINTDGAQINNCTIQYNYIGLALYQAKHSLIANNNVNNSSETGIWLISSTNNTLSGNIVRNSTQMGINLFSSSNNNTLLGNTITNSSLYGIQLSSSSNNTLSGNTITNSSDNGIHLFDSGNNTISGNTLSNNKNGIYVFTSSNNNTLLGNTITYCSQRGILVYDSNYTSISGNTIINSSTYGIELQSSYNNTVSSNTVTNSSWYGILLFTAGNNTILGNNITNSLFSGIYLSVSSSNNSVSNNIITNSSQHGIYLINSNKNIVSGNTVANSTDIGIYLSSSGNSTVSDNIVSASTNYGIYLSQSANSTLTGNTITNSLSMDGIYLTNSGFTNVSFNRISNSSQYGINIPADTGNCTIWGNLITTSGGANAYDANGTNFWDNTTHGNWWDDYTGNDTNYDGIGETAYSILGGAGAQDQFPLVILIQPSNRTSTSDPTPFLDWADLPDASHYHIQIATDSSFSSIDQETTTGLSYWTVGSPLAEDVYYWRVRSNDSTDQWTGWSAWWTITIDFLGPTVTITSPMTISYPTNTIWVNITGDATHYWYYIAGEDSTNQTWTANISRSGLSDGTYTLHAYGNDSAGNEAHTSVTFTIDTIPPTVTITSPSNIIYVSNTIWVNFTGDATNYWYYIAGIDGTNQTWTTNVTRSGLSDGTYTLHAYGNDSAGNVAHSSIGFSINATGAPIYIDENSDFAALGFSGAGTPKDPYVIANYNITDSTATLIHIQDTTDYFIIYNNWLDGINGSYTGIYLQNVTHGAIDNNTIRHGSYGVFIASSTLINVTSNDISQNLKNGLFLQNSNWTIITDNFVYDNGNNTSGGGLRLLAGDIGHGIYLDPSNYNTVANNTVYNNQINGIFLYDSANVTVANNTVYENDANGIFLQLSDNNTIVDNTIYDNGNNTSGGGLRLFAGDIGHGIYLDPSNYNTVANNTVYNNQINGIFLYDTNNVLIANNSVHHNGAHGVYLEDSDDNTLSNNTIHNNGQGAGINASLVRRTSSLLAGDIGHGIYLDPSNNNTLIANLVYNNTGYGILLQGSSGNNVTENVIALNQLYGLDITESANNNDATENDFYGNNPGGTSQANDNGSNNRFAGNYWDDHNNTDGNGDGVADNPYDIDGGANNQDATPNATPNQPVPHFLSAPTVVFPNGGEILGSVVTVEWTAARDSRDHPITYTLYYSADNGGSWSEVASDLKDPFYVWDITDYAEGEFNLIKVVALCAEGLQATDTSDQPFIILHTFPPTVTIESPLNITYATSTITITLTGDADHYWYYIEGVDTANQSWTATIDRTLLDGRYLLHAFGNSSVGKLTHTTVTFAIDTVSPIVTIIRPVEHLEEHIVTDFLMLEWAVEDASALTHAQIEVDGIVVAIIPGSIWRVEIPLEEGLHRIDVIVYDAAGNSGSAMVEVTIKEPKPERTKKDSDSGFSSLFPLLIVGTLGLLVSRRRWGFSRDDSEV
ncbi:MAG: right-handed parallel beta-helix repeat-containing protein [Candidatus Heimdallarchaeota archaeon]